MIGFRRKGASVPKSATAHQVINYLAALIAGAVALVRFPGCRRMGPAREASPGGRGSGR